MSQRHWCLDLSPHRLPGKIISFSGVDGSGKTTTLRLARAFLRARGVPTKVFKLPSRGLKQQEWFRVYSADPLGSVRRGHIDLTAMCAMVLGDRIMTVRGVLLPLLCRGYTVLVDRYLFTPVAELVVHEAPPRVLDDLMPLIRCLPRPDLAVFAHVSPDQARGRVRGRAGEQDDPLTYEVYRRRVDAFRQVAEANQGLVLDTGDGVAKTMRTLAPWLRALIRQDTR